MWPLPAVALLLLAGTTRLSPQTTGSEGLIPDDPALSGAALVSQCRYFQSSLEGKPTRKEDIEGVYACPSYLEGLIDGQTFGSKAYFCIPHAPIGDVIRAYLLWMDHHPEELLHLRAIGVIAALHAAYPCGAQREHL